jgi:N-acetylmuramoyl-L-alanine amidase
MKPLFLIDPGHGGTYPKGHEREGEYTTRGNRSPKWDDKQFADGSPFVLYEGVNNRDNAKRLLEAMELHNLDAIDIVNDWRDISLTERVKRANELARKQPCFYISIHSNAAGRNGDWTTASGNGIYIAPNASKNSRRMAEIMADVFKKRFADVSKWRGIKERNFYVTSKTACPAILIEAEFHDNKESAKLMLTDDYKTRLINSIIDAACIYGENN